VASSSGLCIGTLSVQQCNRARQLLKRHSVTLPRRSTSLKTASLLSRWEGWGLNQERKAVGQIRHQDWQTNLYFSLQLPVLVGWQTLAIALRAIFHLVSTQLALHSWVMAKEWHMLDPTAPVFLFRISGLQGMVMLEREALGLVRLVVLT
jgi:glutathione S-transferase